MYEKGKKIRVPAMFRSLLWDLDWSKVDAREDKDDIILGALNMGTLKHVNWITAMYGPRGIRSVLERRLETELYPESRNLARVLFGVNHFYHERKSTHSNRAKTFSKARTV